MNNNKSRIGRVHLLALLIDIKPELQSRIDQLNSAWPGGEVLLTLHKVEGLMRRIDEVIDNEIANEKDCIRVYNELKDLF
jgi:hypothetical protein